MKNKMELSKQAQVFKFIYPRYYAYSLPFLLALLAVVYQATTMQIIIVFFIGLIVTWLWSFYLKRKKIIVDGSTLFYKKNSFDLTKLKNVDAIVGYAPWSSTSMENIENKIILLDSDGNKLYLQMGILRSRLWQDQDKLLLTIYKYLDANRGSANTKAQKMFDKVKTRTN